MRNFMIRAILILVLVGLSVVIYNAGDDNKKDSSTNDDRFIAAHA